MQTRLETINGVNKAGEPAMVEIGTIIHNGHEHKATGAAYDGQRAAGYLTLPDNNDGPGHIRRGNITSWEGKPIGVAVVVARWATPASHMSSHMFQVEARINGVFYTGRTAGCGMLWQGKRKAAQRFS